MTARSLEIFANMDQTTAVAKEGERREGREDTFWASWPLYRFAHIICSVASFLTLWDSLISGCVIHTT